jgi:hypothetical protein
MRHFRRWSKTLRPIAFIVSAIAATILTIEAFRLPWMVALQPHLEWRTGLLYPRGGTMVGVVNEDGDNSACTKTPNSCIWVVSERAKLFTVFPLMAWLITALLRPERSPERLRND